MADRPGYFLQRDRNKVVITRGAVLQTAEGQTSVDPSKSAQSLSAALGDMIFNPINTSGSTVSVAGSVLEYKHAMSFSDGRVPKRNAQIWVDGSGIASRHCIEVVSRLSGRMDSGRHQRRNITTPMSQRVGGASPAVATIALSQLATTWMDDETSSWAPLFERLWAGFYTAQFGVAAGAQVGESGRTPSTLWPAPDHMPDALVVLRTSARGLGRILVRELTAVTPTNLDIFDVFCAVTTSHLGFQGDGDRAGNHWAGSKPFLEMPEILIVASNNRPERYHAGYTRSSILDSRNWLSAIHWLLRQDLPSADCLAGLELMMRHCVFFFSPFSTMLSIAPEQRMVSCTNLADVVYTRYLVMAYKTATGTLANRGATVTAAIAALGGVIAAEVVVLNADPVGRDQDIGWLFWLHGCDFTRAAINTMLTQCSSTILIKIATWAADDAWEAAWVGGLNAIAHRSLTPPTGQTAAQFMTDIADGGILDRSLSIPLFNFHEWTTQHQSSGLDLLHAENSRENFWPDKSRGLIAVLRNVTPSQMILNLIVASVACRSVVDFHAMVLGMSSFGQNLARGYNCDSGDNIVDQVVNRSEQIVSAPGQLMGLAGLDALMATHGLATSFTLQVDARQLICSSIPTSGLWEEYRFLNIQVLHPLVQQSFCPGLPVAGGALDRKMIWVNQFPCQDIPFYLGFQYGGDLTQQELLGAIQLVSWSGNQHIALIPYFEDRELAWRMTDMPCRDSDYFPGVATLAVPPVWLVSTNLPTTWVYAPTTTAHYCRSLYYMPHAADAYPMCEVPAGAAAEGTIHEEAQIYSSGKASYIMNAMRAENLQPPGLATGGTGWGAPVGVAGADVCDAIVLGYNRLLKAVDTAQPGMDILKPRISVHLSAGTSYLEIATRRGLSGAYPYAAGRLFKTVVENGRAAALKAGESKRCEVPGVEPDREENNPSSASVSELQAQIAALQALLKSKGLNVIT